MAKVRNFHGWQRMAERRLPRAAFDFLEGGAEDEVTLRRNRAAFDTIALIPRMLRGVGDVSLETSVCGRRVELPVLLAPAGNARLAGPGAEIAQARGASAAGTVAILSNGTSLSPAKVAASISDALWFHTTIYRDRARMKHALDRTKSLGFEALVVTVDTPVGGNRERDVRNGVAAGPPKLSARHIIEGLRRPRWAWRYVRGGPPIPHIVSTFGSVAEATATLFHPEQSWTDLEWVREAWDGPLILKGVMCGEDAELAVQAGCDGVVVSNHGGRQLDGTPASIEMLSEVVGAVGGRVDVLVDSGFRRGTDVVKALCLGARACLIGRPWWYGVASGGEAGVAEVLSTFRDEMVRTLQLLGASTLDELGPEFVRRRPGSGWERVERLERAAP